jgi:hypothetical protein
MNTSVKLPICSATGCVSPVSKAGYSLCYAHWAAQKNNRATKSETENSAASGVGNIESIAPKTNGFLTSTQLGERLNLNVRKLNQVLSELGWIERAKKGWVPTEQGLKLHAEAREHHQTGIPFVLWSESILASRILTNTVNELLGTKAAETIPSPLPVVVALKIESEKGVGFREKFKPTHRAMDGHWVRSRAEALIDNWLYMSGIVHAYERLLPVEEELYCDFYIPSGKVYIEYWGLENDPKYKARKDTKKSIYSKYGFNLIELADEHIQNLDDYLPKMLLKFNVISE